MRLSDLEKLNECQKALDMKAKTIEDILEHIHGEVENAKKRKNDAYAASYYGQLINEKWVFLEDVTALLMKLVQERDDNKLLVIQAVTKLRAKEEQLEGKVLIDRKQLTERVLEIDKPANDYGEVCEQNRQYRILVKELLSGSEGSKELLEKAPAKTKET